MKNKIVKGMSALLLASLISCGVGERKSADKVEVKFPDYWESSEKAIKGGTYKLGVVSTAPFKGILNEALYTDAVDSYFLGPISAELFRTGPDFKLIPGMASYEVNVDAKTVTVKLQENLKWDDGEPLTIDDYIYVYELLANRDYTGVRYDENIENVVGMKEYHEGKAKTISGLEKISDTEVVIHLQEMKPTLETGAGGLLTYIIPKHTLSKIPVKDLEHSDAVRKNPVGAGAFRITQIVPGESIEYEPNPYYYLNDKFPAQVDKLIVKIVPQSSALASMKSGEYDVYYDVNEDIYTEYKDFDNITALGRAALYYQYLGFNLGHYDDNLKENVTDTNAKMYDINLRKSIGYAIDVEQITEIFYNGLRTRANSVIPPVFKDFYSDKQRFTYNPEKAKEILDKAGYKDVDGDGIREDKNGQPLVISFAFPNMGEIGEPLSQKIIQDLEEVGLKVVLTGGRLIEGNSFFDRLRVNDKEIDMWIAAWSVGSSFNLNGLYGKKSAFNYSRLASEKNSELMAKVDSLEGLKDPQYRINAIREWEDNYMENELGFLPITFRYQLRPVNKRVKSYSYSFDSTKYPESAAALTSIEPLKSTK